MAPSMRADTLLWFLTILMLCSCFCEGSTYIESERIALFQFKQDLKDHSNRLSSWAVEENCCKWTGIVCDNLTGHVNQIRLRGPNPHSYYEELEFERSLSYGLGGKLNPSLLNLKHLKYLDLSSNSFVGIQIPSFVGSLANLRYLNLSHSGFQGMIPPELGNLTMMRYLSLDFRFRFEDDKPSVESLQWLSGFPLLQHLDLSGLNLSKAKDWLQVIQILPSLVELHLSHCQLSYIPPLRTVPLDIDNCNMTSLRNLISLDLSYNDIQGPIPRCLHNITSLRDLYLSGNNFSSTIPNWLYNLSHLEFLGLSRNNLRGVISSAIGNMTSLISLDLSYNQLTGRLPNSLRNLCNLKHIYFSGNNFGLRVSEVVKTLGGCNLNRLESFEFDSSQLYGDLPDELGQFNNLVDLSLCNNSISGPIPATIGRLASLQVLNLSHNQLNGTLPESLGQLLKLEYLNLQKNSLKGVVSEVHFANLSQLHILDASDNGLTLKPSIHWVPPFQLHELYLRSCQLGPQFPLWLQWQNNLYGLDIANTGIEGTIPIWFWTIFDIPSSYQLDMPVVIDLSSNHLKGPLPLISSNVDFLSLSNNSFSGSLYHFLCDKAKKPTRLQGLNLDNNLLSGRIPDCLMNWQSLSALKLANNNLMGSIPSSMGYLSSLKALDMHNNNLSGELPKDLKNWTQLEIMNLAENEFVGSIPTLIGTKLKVLSLRSNKFGGNIPYELCHHTSIQVLDLAHNNLSGMIPRCFNNFSVMAAKISSTATFPKILYGPYMEIQARTVLFMKGREDEYKTTLKLVTILDLSSNNLSGEIPNELMSLIGLLSLNLSGNNLTGRIPEKIGEMKHLESLDFSMNQLFGEIPSSMSRMTFLSHLNLSYNNLIGKIPSSTQFQTLDESSFIGNNLCGPPLTERCEKHVENKVEEGDDIHEMDWLLVTSVATGFLISFGAVMVPLLVNMPWRITYYIYMDHIWYQLSDVICRYCCHMFNS